MQDESEPAGSIEHRSEQAYVVVKAAPRLSQKHGETVCIAALTREGNWVRLYPVSFRYLEQAKRFKRWDLVSYRFRKPKTSADSRDESRRVDPNSIEILSHLRVNERNNFTNRVAVTSLVEERRKHRSLALLRAEVVRFSAHRRNDDDMRKAQATYEVMRSQSDLFSSGEVSRTAADYEFRYRFRDADGEHTGVCQDWETEQTFLRQRRELGEAKALEWMIAKFGEEYPRKGMALAMGTHRYRSDQWLINGVIRLDDVPQLDFLSP